MRLVDFVPPIVTKVLGRRQQTRPQFFGLNGLDEKLQKYLSYPNGFFVELGANDGITQSNTLYYERFRNWHGILVEPTPHNFLKCRKNRSPYSKVFCNACTSFEYKEKFVEIAYSNLMSSPMGLESDINDPIEHAAKGKVFLEPTEVNFTFGALARPLNDILIEANAPEVIDFLSLDVEGAEIEVLKGIDYSRFRFRFMCIETRSSEVLAAFLAPHGYRPLEKLSFHDHLFGFAPVLAV